MHLSPSSHINSRAGVLGYWTSNYGITEPTETRKGPGERVIKAVRVREVDKTGGPKEVHGTFTDVTETDHPGPVGVVDTGSNCTRMVDKDETDLDLDPDPLEVDPLSESGPRVSCLSIRIHHWFLVYCSHSSPVDFMDTHSGHPSEVVDFVVSSYISYVVHYGFPLPPRELFSVHLHPFP